MWQDALPDCKSLYFHFCVSTELSHKRNNLSASASLTHHNERGQHVATCPRVVNQYYEHHETSIVNRSVRPFLNSHHYSFPFLNRNMALRPLPLVVIFVTFLCRQTGVAVTFEISISELLGSKFGQDTTNSGRGFIYFSSVPPEKCQYDDSIRPWTLSFK